MTKSGHNIAGESLGVFSFLLLFSSKLQIRLPF